MASSSKPSFGGMPVSLTKTSSIFDADSIKQSRQFPAGQSTTSFGYEPSHTDERASRVHRAAYYEHTYRLTPVVRFKPQLVSKIIKSVLEDRLTDLKYDPTMAADECRLVAAEIQRLVKRQRFDRYKYVVNVTIGQKAGQSVDIASRCSWDKESDSMASATFETPTFYAVAIVFGIYYE